MTDDWVAGPADRVTSLAKVDRGLRTRSSKVGACRVTVENIVLSCLLEGSSLARRRPEAGVHLSRRQVSPLINPSPLGSFASLKLHCKLTRELTRHRESSKFASTLTRKLTSTLTSKSSVFQVPTLISPNAFRALLVFLLLSCFGMVSAVRAELPACVTNQPILFVVRNQYRGDHHNTATFFPSAPNEYNDGYYQAGGALKTYDPATGQITTLHETATGVIRDPDVHFDGDRIVFSMRNDSSDSYHIYEINADGTGLTQLTSLTDVDDLDPIYMPSGKIVFTSTREPKYIPCNRHIGANIYSMDGDGANINQISRNALFDDHPSLMPDGRIMYSRWEYVDRNFGDAQGLWTCDPGGTGHAIYYGNNTSSPGGVVDGRVIPGTQTTVCTFTSCHDRPWGAIAIIDRRKGVDGRDAVVRTWPAGLESWVSDAYDFDKFKATPIKHEDPYPLADPDTGVGGRYFLCSRQVSGEEMAIYLLDAEGAETLLHNEGSGQVGCYDPMPLAPRPRPHDVTVYRKHNGQDGRFLVLNVYDSTHMAGVAPGEVKHLRVVEAPEKRGWNHSFWNGNGFEGPGMNWHNFINKRVLGTVPVEADGSAHFNAPSSTFLFFQLLDEDKRMIQSMRSGTIIQPGESQSCIGCHDDRGKAPAAYGATMPQAALRDPSPLGGWYGEPRPFNYLSEVQPVWDANCMSCHDWGGTGAGKVVLARDKGLFFNASYTELWRKGYTGAIGAGPAAIQQAKSWGSHNSTLMNTILAGHNEVSLTTEELERVATWLDLNAPYYPEYYTSYPGHLAGRSPLNGSQLSTLGALTGRNFSGMNRWSVNPGPQVCFDRPEKSPCLAGLTGADYDAALAIIQAGQATLAALPRADMPGFQPTGTDAWREQKFAGRRNREDMNQAALNGGAKAWDGQPLLLVMNQAPVGIDGVSAQAEGELLYTVSNATATAVICWGASDEGTDVGAWEHCINLPPQGTGDFALVLPNLVPGADVYFRCFASNEAGVVWSSASTVFDTRSLIDLDGDGMADNWETAHFGSDGSAAPGDDWDGDGSSNADEYWAGTDPTNAASVLAIESVEFAGASAIIRWQSASNALYTVDVCSNLTSGAWQPLAQDVTATPPLNERTTNLGAARQILLRVRGARTDR